MAAAARREELGLGESDAFTASEFPRGRNYDRVVAISRSGTTTEVHDLLQSLQGVKTIAITAVDDSPIAQAADETILLDFADEQSVLQTRYATTVLALLRAHYGEDLGACIEQGQAMLELEIPEPILTAEQITFLGTGWSVGIAHEAALKTRESSQFWAEAYPAMDYRHGPISIAQPGRVVWFFGAPPAQLVEDVESRGAIVEVRDIDPMAHLVLAQRAALKISEARGLDPDNPRGLARSIILS
jgi:fructoselysine-6-P-deglycase FrlB-like protein